MTKTTKEVLALVPEEEEGESYPTYTNNGPVHVTISGNNNVVNFFVGKPTPPPPPPHGGGQ